MRVSFELTRDDYAALSFARSPSPMLSKTRWLVLAALCGAVLVLMGLLSWLTGGLEWLDETPLLRPLLYAAGVCLGALVALALLLRALRAWVRRLPREDGATLGPHELSLDEAGLRVTGRSGHSFVAWPAIVEIRETGDHLFLYVDRMMAYVVPKRAFASPAECASFAEFARARAGRRTP